MIYPKGCFMIFGSDIANSDDPDRPLVKAAYGESISEGKRTYLIEHFYKDVFDGIRFGDYLMYVNPWNKDRVIVLYQGNVIEHRPKSYKAAEDTHA